MNFQPHVRNGLVTLRPLQRKDFEALYEVASDPEIWEQHPANDRWQESVFRTFFNEAMDCEKSVIAIDSKTGKVIGNSRYHDFGNGIVEIGWSFLAREYWGGEYNAAFKNLMIQGVKPAANTILFFIGSENIRSQKSVMKLGAKKLTQGPLLELSPKSKHLETYALEV